VEAATFIRSARRRRRKTPPPTAVTAVYRKESDPMFVILDKAKSNKENIRGLNFAAVKPTTVQVTTLPLQDNV
jgi:hypothetical protein